MSAFTTSCVAGRADTSGQETAQLEDPDREVARRFAAGDSDSVRELYARWAGPVYTVAMSWLRDRALAQEAVQDTFLKAWRASATLDPQRGVGPWLYTIARRAAMDIARRERRRPRTTSLPATIPAAEADTLDRTWEAWQVRCALRELPDDQRELIRLTHYMGLTHAQIAHRLGVPIGTVKSRTHRAHRRLAQLLTHLQAER